MNIFQNAPQNAPQETCETILQSQNVRIERIVLDGQSSPPDFWYDQSEHEWILLLQGHAALRFESETEDRVLDVGDCLDIAAGVRHQVRWTSDSKPTIWLAIWM